MKKTIAGLEILTAVAMAALSPIDQGKAQAATLASIEVFANNIVSLWILSEQERCFQLAAKLREREILLDHSESQEQASHDSTECRLRPLSTFLRFRQQLERQAIPQ